MSDWNPTGSAPQNQVVMTKISDEKGERNEGPLFKSGQMWWTPDGEMYVYYRPTHWRPLSAGESRDLRDRLEARRANNDAAIVRALARVA
jgi:hypothetical protein